MYNTSLIIYKTLFISEGLWKSPHGATSSYCKKENSFHWSFNWYSTQVRHEQKWKQDMWDFKKINSNLMCVKHPIESLIELDLESYEPTTFLHQNCKWLLKTVMSINVCVQCKLMVNIVQYRVLAHAQTTKQPFMGVIFTYTPTNLWIYWSHCHLW